VVAGKPILGKGQNNKYSALIDQPFIVTFTYTDKLVPKGQGGLPTLSWKEITNYNYMWDSQTKKWLVPANQTTELTTLNNPDATAFFKAWTKRTHDANEAGLSHTVELVDKPGVYILTDKDGNAVGADAVNGTNTNKIVISVTNPAGCGIKTLTKTGNIKIVFKNADVSSSPPPTVD
jgi:hypothetical protein